MNNHLQVTSSQINTENIIVYYYILILLILLYIISFYAACVRPKQVTANLSKIFRTLHHKRVAGSYPHRQTCLRGLSDRLELSKPAQNNQHHEKIEGINTLVINKTIFLLFVGRKH